MGETMLAALVGGIIGFASSDARAAGAVSIGGQAPGPTPFIASISASVSGATLASLSVEVAPRSASFTRPLVATYQAATLTAQGRISGNTVTIPVFGLYAGTANTVALQFQFTDGSVIQKVVPVTTAAYVDPCAQVNSVSIQQHRQGIASLGFDYFLLKDSCSSNSPAIMDTDGQIRWVSPPHGTTQSSIFYNNGILVGDGATGVIRLELDGQATKLADYASIGVTDTGHHNYDRGRDGVVLDVNTTTQTESVDIEVNGMTGQVLQTWDLSQIISAAMTAGGDDPTQFVRPVGTDWFHNNATTYNPSDNTLIVSSRENFVIAVDYDAPPTGMRKIHWILGDTTKHWAQFASLRKFALKLAPGTLPPIGQHAISIDHNGNVLLFDDGYGSAYQQPPGLTRTYSAVRSYSINTAAMVAQAAFPFLYTTDKDSIICGSVYEPVPGYYLVDYATANGDKQAEIQGIGSHHSVVVDLILPEVKKCGVGWNAEPLPTSQFHF